MVKFQRYCVSISIRRTQPLEIQDDVFIDGIWKNIILGTQFINWITPYKVINDANSFKNQI